MTINDIIEASGIPAKSICARFGIPQRTMRAWQTGYRKPSDYILVMLADIFTLELMLDAAANNMKEDKDNAEEEDRLGEDLLGDCCRGRETCEESKSEDAQA